LLFEKRARVTIGIIIVADIARRKSASLRSAELHHVKLRACENFIRLAVQPHRETKKARHSRAF
jgi:hypothetical protein